MKLLPFALLLAGCGKDVQSSAKPRVDEVQSSAAEEKAAPELSPTPEPEKKKAAENTEHAPFNGRLVAVGDVHGDLAATRSALRLAKLIDEKDRWIGGETVLVQTGDQLDRGDDEREILALFERLQKEAAEAGGRFVILNGNHEYMNALGDLRYVTPGGFEDFDGAQNPRVDASALAEVPAHAKGRLLAFVPGGEYAKKLAKRSMAVIVGDSVFVHGGIRPAYARIGIEALNEQSQQWLRGELAEPPKAIVDSEGPVWTRAYSGNPAAIDCDELSQSLALLGVKRMVVGHTVDTKGIRSACDDKVWMIDVGMAAHYGGQPAALEIQGAELRILR